jgi:hypothetical protein
MVVAVVVVALLRLVAQEVEVLVEHLTCLP